jgi:hypothetical protein
MPLPAQFTEWLRAHNERFARFSGSQFSPHELPGGPPYEDKAAVRQATKRCKDCEKRKVKLRQRYCSVLRKNAHSGVEAKAHEAKTGIRCGKTRKFAHWR